MTLSNKKTNRKWSFTSIGLRKKYIILILIALLIFLPFVPYMSENSSMLVECIFCKIVQRKMPETKIEFETEEFVIFKDIKPASTHHYLAVTKRHIDSLKNLTKSDEDLVLHMEKGLKEVFSTNEIDANDALFGFHMPPFISVKHLHMHGISPRSTMSFLNRFMFMPSAPWFKTTEDALRYIREKVE